MKFYQKVIIRISILKLEIDMHACKQYWKHNLFGGGKNEIFLFRSSNQTDCKYYSCHTFGCTAFQMKTLFTGLYLIVIAILRLTKHDRIVTNTNLFESTHVIVNFNTFCAIYAINYQLSEKGIALCSHMQGFFFFNSFSCGSADVSNNNNNNKCWSVIMRSIWINKQTGWCCGAKLWFFSVIMFYLIAPFKKNTAKIIGKG